MTDSTILFRDALQSIFGPLDFLPVPDGAIHRFRVPDDKPGTLNGWYVLYLDGMASGAFGSWKTNRSSAWSSRIHVDYREAEQVRQHIEQARRQREAEQQLRQLKTASLAQRWWRDAHPADPDHAYLIAKGVRVHSLRQRGDELLVPLYSDGVLANLQRIAPDGGTQVVCYSIGDGVTGAWP